MPQAELNDLQEAVLEALNDARLEKLAFINRSELLRRLQNTPGFDDTSHQKLGPCTTTLRRRGLMEEPRAGRLYITDAGIEALGSLPPMPEEREPESAERPVPSPRQEPEALVPELEEPTVKDCLGAYVSPTEWRNCPGCGSPPGKFHDPECPKTNAFQAGRISETANKEDGPLHATRPSPPEGMTTEAPAAEEVRTIRPATKPELDAMNDQGIPFASGYIESRSVGWSPTYRDPDPSYTVDLPKQGPLDWLDSGMDVEYQDDHADDPPKPHVTTLMVAIHPAGTNWMGSDNTVVLKIDDEGAGPYLQIGGLDGPLQVEDLDTLNAIRNEGARLLREARRGEEA